MFKKRNILLLFLLVTTFVFSQKKTSSTVKNSVLSQGSWYKFAIDTTGVFKIDRRFLRDLGLNTNEINPKNIKIYGNGGQLLPMLNSDFRYDGLQENALFISGEDDGRFDANDFILFYGKGPHQWKINTSLPNSSRHQTNIYSDKAFYFLTVDGGLGKRITTAADIAQPSTLQVTTYNDYVYFEEDEVNLFDNGQQWFGQNLSFDNTTTINFNFENLDTSQEIAIRVRGVTISSTLSEMNVTVNDQSLMTIEFPNIPNGPNNLILGTTKEGIATITASSNPVKVEITYNNNNNPSARAYLDYVELIGIKKLIANGKQFSFRNFSTANLPTTSIVEYTIQNNTNISQVWDVTDYINPTIINNQSNGTDFIFKSNGDSLKEFIVLNDADYFTPEILPVSFVANQNLHSLKDIDYIIITQDYLMSEAERLAAYHRENSGLTVKVIELQEIYNEFSSGSPDLTAIRDFVRHFYTNATSDDTRIKYLCLFGDASFDYKDRINNNNNIVPSLQSFQSFDLANSYVTDDYYGMMDDNEGTLQGFDKQDVPTGRYPVTTIDQAKSAVDKTLNYYATTSFGDWRNNIAVVADDPDLPREFSLQETVERIADTITNRRPIFNLKKIYADAFVQETSAGGERYPDVNEAIDNSIETGSLVMDYFGHGGEDGWAGERILEVSQIQDWNNLNTLALMITVTCEFSRFDNPLRPTAGEFVFLNKVGGSASMITTTREIFISVGQRFNNILVKKLFGFNGEDYTIAEAMMQMKNDPGANSEQRLFVFYLGDPAMKLAQPKPNIKLTKMNGVDISQATDTLKALSKITLEGVVTDIADNVLTDFNGEVSTTIFDKSVDRTTLDNNNFGARLTFDAIESKIFRGRASVTNGVFNFSFIVPKDIRIAFGKAKISMYADDKIIDKAGVNQEIIVGGINENAPEDIIGPTIQLFMDDESFVDGGNTSESPHFIAVLEDASGINTSITAVDHDIVAILDGNQASPFILNDFYQTELDDFTKGKVRFPFRNLAVGPHTINFKCWDTYNNPSESTLNFVVVDDRDLVLSNVLNYPNPFINYTEFWFNHNKPNEPLEVQVQIFTVSGKLIKTISQLVQSENLSRSISWNGLDDFGNKIGKGVYIYKLNVKSVLSNTKAVKFEKLVILQ